MILKPAVELLFQGSDGGRGAFEVTITCQHDDCGILARSGYVWLLTLCLEWYIQRLLRSGDFETVDVN